MRLNAKVHEERVTAQIPKQCTKVNYVHVYQNKATKISLLSGNEIDIHQ